MKKLQKIDNRYEDGKKDICEWDCSKKTSLERKSTLEDQSEETQRKINELNKQL